MSPIPYPGLTLHRSVLPIPAPAPFTASSQKAGNLPPSGGAVLGKGRWSCAGLGPQRTGAEGRSGCPALTGHLLFRSSGSWTSSPQPPPSATSMTCESGCARFQDVCRPCLPLGGQVRGGSRFSLLAKGRGGLPVPGGCVPLGWGEIQPRVERTAGLKRWEGLFTEPS